MNIRWLVCVVIALFALLRFHYTASTPANIVGYTTLFLATIILSLHYFERSD